MWYAIIGSLVAAFSAGIIYISFRSANFGFVKKIAGGRRWLARLICLGAFALIALALALLWNVMNALVCFVHLVLIWLICDIAVLVISKIRGKKRTGYLAGAFAVLICTAYLTYGWICAHHVRQTDYTFTTSEIKDNIRIVQITDSHIGATFDAAGFSEYIEEINALSPDVVVVTGDFVDDNTSRDDMLGGCEALGRLNTKYGVLFVYGNHDRGYYKESEKGWTNFELRQNLEANGVILLEDKAYDVGDSVCIIGRKDRYDDMRGSPRKSAAELMAETDKSKYVIMLDHQPHDFDAEAEAGADLVLCGHTHGGQFIPINHVGEWMGENCLRYGHEKRLDTDFIVSSGISNWTFKFKTGCFSEYVVIDITGK